MNLYGWLHVVVYFTAVLILVKPLGAYMTKVYQNGHLVLDPLLGPLERFLYRLSGIDPRTEMTWKTYAIAMLVFNILGVSPFICCNACKGFCLRLLIMTWGYPRRLI